MAKYSIILPLLCCFHSLIGASVVTKYEIVSSRNTTVSLLSCGHSPLAFGHCAVRLGNNTCEPITGDWSNLSLIEPDSTYLVKRTVTDRLETSLVSSYNRTLPFVLSQGSEIEIKFILRSNWTEFVIDLMDNKSNIVLRINMLPGSVLFSTKVHAEVEWKPARPAKYEKLKINEEYTLNIVIAKEGFRINLNGQTDTYVYKLPANTIREMDSFCPETHCDLREVTFKAGV